MTLAPWSVSQESTFTTFGTTRLTTIAPNATTKELMVFGGHSSPRAALIYQAATAKRMEAIPGHLDEVMASAKRAPKSAAVPIRS